MQETSRIDMTTAITHHSADAQLLLVIGIRGLGGALRGVELQRKIGG